MDPELKSLLDVLIGKIEGLQTTVHDVKGTVTGLQTTVTGLQTTVTGLQTSMTGLQTTVEDLQGTVGGLQADVHDVRVTQKVILARLDGMDKRFDDQSRVLAALIPSRIAAVPAAE